VRTQANIVYDLKKDKVLRMEKEPTWPTLNSVQK